MRPALYGLAFGMAMLLSTVAKSETIKLATIAPQDSPYYDVLRDLAEDWDKASGGAVSLKIYAGGVAGDEPDVVRKIRVGQLQAAAMSGGGLPDIAPEVRALQLPMMFASSAERDYVADRIHYRLEPIMADRGVKVLGWSPAGWAHFYSSSPVITPDDLRALRVHAWAGNTNFVDAWRAAGFQPVALPATEIMTGLQTGLIDAVAAPPIAALSFQWFGPAPHMADFKWVSLEGALIISVDAWERIPADLRPLLEQSARDACRRLAMIVERFNHEAVDVMKKHGLKVHQVSADQKQAWEAAARASYPFITGKMVPAEIVAEVRRLRDEYRATHPIE